MKPFPTYQIDNDLFTLCELYFGGSFAHDYQSIHQDVSVLKNEYNEKYKWNKEKIESFREQVHHFRTFSPLLKFIYFLFHWNIRKKDQAVRTVDVYEKISTITSLLGEIQKIQQNCCNCPSYLKKYQENSSNEVEASECLSMEAQVDQDYSPFRINQKLENTTKKIIELGHLLLYVDMDTEIKTSYFHSHPKLIEIRNKYYDDLVSHLYTNFFHRKAKEIGLLASQCWEACQDILDTFRISYSTPDGWKYCDRATYQSIFNKTKTASENEAIYQDRSTPDDKTEARRNLSKFFAIKTNAPDDHFRSAYKRFMLGARSDQATEGNNNLVKIQEINHLMDVTGLRK